MNTWAGRAAALALTFVQCLACGGGDDGGTEPGGCQKDTDCASGRICESGTCVNASGGSGGSGTGATNNGTGGIATSTSGGCTPQCGNRVCGPDPECGQSCGACDAGRECVAGECRADGPLKENGDTCSTNAECASDFCAENNLGEQHCYGNGSANDICTDSYDCGGGICIPRSLTGTGDVCVEGAVVCLQEEVSPECTDFVVAFCQLIQFCGEDVSSSIPEDLKDFDFCVGSECLNAMDGTSDLTPAECLEGEAGILSGSWPCP